MLKIQPIDRPLVGVLFLLALSTLGLAAAIASQNPSPRPTETAQHQQQNGKEPDAPTSNENRNSSQTPLLIKILPTPDTPEKTEHDAKEREEKATLDGRTLLLTEITAVILFLQLVVFGSQARRLRQTVIAMDSQSADMKIYIRETTKSANAAVESSKISAQLLESDRAWITWHKINYVGLKNVRFGDTIYSDSLATSSTWKNTGRSPALDVRVVNIAVAKNKGDEVPFFTWPDLERETQQSSLGVGSEASGFVSTISDADYIDFTKKIKDIILYSAVKYTDVFRRDVVHLSEACMMISYTGGRISRNGKEEPPYSAAVVGSQNGLT